MLVHDKLGAVVLIVAVVGALAAVIAMLRPHLMPMVRVYLRLTVGLAAVQAVVGLVLVIGGMRPSQGIHWFYGVATLISLPLAMWTGRRVGAREEPLWIVGGAVATVLFALRALGTG